jgi:hypothetical protein
MPSKAKTASAISTTMLTLALLNSYQGPTPPTSISQKSSLVLRDNLLQISADPGLPKWWQKNFWFDENPYHLNNEGD